MRTKPATRTKNLVVRVTPFERQLIEKAAKDNGVRLGRLTRPEQDYALRLELRTTWWSIVKGSSDGTTSGTDRRLRLTPQSPVTVEAMAGLFVERMRQPRFERGTFGSGGRRSIQLSYWRARSGCPG
jgi:hypothetical protein